jgi:hypothetical protein
MWLLPTRNRPEMCQRALDACIASGTTSRGMVWMDGCDYGKLRLPDGWGQVACDEHLNIGEIMRRFFAQYPGLGWYGWLADDCIPVTMGWDRRLIEAAEHKFISYPNDNWQQGVKERDGTPHVTSVICMGGDLVRAMGFWVLPGMVQMYIDDVWESVAVPAGLMRYQPDVLCEHHHFANGKRPHDATDARVFAGQPFPKNDREIYQSWLGSERLRSALGRVSTL